jgi:ABC-type transporter Mla subunit MlaD
LRQKTLLGETYVQITPGSPRSPPIPDGGILSRTQVVPAVQLDEIFNAFDPPTRHAFMVWQQELARAVRGNDQNLNDVLGNLPTFVADFTDVLRVLDVQHLAVVRLVQNGGTTFAALSQDPAALRNLITAGDTTFRTTADNQAALADVFHIFPTFLTEQRLTMARLKSFSLDADPVIKELIPVAQQLKPTLDALRQLAPPLRNLFVNLGPLITVSQKGLPATAEVLYGLQHVGCAQHCVLGALGPFLEQLNPVLSWLSLHQQLISDFLSGAESTMQAKTPSFSGGGVGHYLRQFAPNGPETLSFVPQRNPDNRGNVYPPPLWLTSGEPRDFTKGNLPAWDCKNTRGDHGVQPGPPEQPACWTAPNLPGASGKYQIPHIAQARYSRK